MRNFASLLLLGAVTLSQVAAWQWVQVWNDEFDGGSVDRSKWHFDQGGNGWGNNELENYTDRP